MLSRRLERQGYSVVLCSDGKQALERVRRPGVELVLLEIMKSDEKLRDIPVIMISALDEIQSIVRCIERGAEDYLPKPFDPVLLRARIGACLEKKRLRDQEVLYLRDVGHVTHAAAAVEAGQFAAETL